MKSKSVIKMISLFLAVVMIITAAPVIGAVGVEDGVSAVSSNNSEEYPLSDVFYDIVDDFGAVPNDPTFDNIPIIQEALNTLRLKGGGTLVFPVGTYYVKPSATNYVNCSWANNITLSGNNATIAIAPDTVEYKRLFLISGHGLTIENLTFDSNIDNTQMRVPVSSEDATTEDMKDPRRQRIIEIPDFAEKVVLRNLKFNNCGTQTVYFKAINSLIDNCTFNFVTPTNPQEEDITPGTSYIEWYDASTLYIVGKNITVQNSRFIADNENFVPNTAIEAHITDSTFDNIYIDGYIKGMLFCDISPARPQYGLDGTARNLKVTNSTFNIVNEINCPRDLYAKNTSAIVFAPEVSTTDPKGTMSDIVISNNIMNTMGNGIGIGGSSVVPNILIDSNVINYVGVENTSESVNGLIPINTSGRILADATAAVNCSATGTDAEHVTISNNRITNFPDLGIKFALRPNGTAEFRDINILNNSFYNCTYNEYCYSESVIFLRDNVISANVSGNSFVFDRTDYPARLPIILPDARKLSNVESIRYADNSFVGYPDMSGILRYTRDYNEEKFDFGYEPNQSSTLSVASSSGVTRLQRGDIFTKDGTTYRCLDSVNLSNTNQAAVVTETLSAGYTYKVSGISKFEIGDRVYVDNGRRCYIYNIEVTDAENDIGIIYGAAYGIYGTNYSPFPGSFGVGGNIYLDTEITTTDSSNLKSTVEIY